MGPLPEIFVNKDNIDKGKRFISTHMLSLEKPKKLWSSTEVIAAIIGIETKYGKNQGKFPVFDTLATLLLKVVVGKLFPGRVGGFYIALFRSGT